ncbi:MAG: ATP-dependent protease subunit HslV [Deltaproteobacteria bacterium]|nr:ATP-dependent protease subunit HslV [Deltaproteobacteria bacterium]
MFKGTTILAVRSGGVLAFGGDGQVTMGETIMKHGARKVRWLFDHQVLAGFAGSTADAFTLFERFEEKLNLFNGNLTRAAVEMAKDWRMDKMLRRLEALMVIGNEENTLVLSGNGDVIEPDDQVVAIGSGAPYAEAAARALVRHSQLPAAEIVREALEITSGICIYTNNQYVIETLELAAEAEKDKEKE